SGVVSGFGGSTANARLKIGTGRFDVGNLCSCRQAREEGTICAHVVALVYAYLRNETTPLTLPSPPRGEETAISHERAGDSFPLPRLGGEEKGEGGRLSAPRLKRVTREDASSGGQSLELAVLLPLDFSKAWKSGEMRIILE